MRLLADTHVFLWIAAEPLRLSERVREMITDAANQVYLSHVSVWEIAIKHALKPGSLPISGSAALQYFTESGFLLLAVSPQHAAGVEQLPLLHADPFDRMLVAQALTEPLRLVTADEKVARYSDSIIFVD